MPKAPQQHGIDSQAYKHSVAKRHRGKERRDASHKRGYNKKWERFSKSFLFANPLCEFCKAQGRARAARVTDHDIPHQHDPELFWNNTFTALCFPCHNSTKQSMERRYQGDDLLEAIARKKAGGGSIS